MYTKSIIRDAFGESLVEAGRLHPEMFVLTPELKTATRCGAFAQMFPERFLDVGIAEQNMVGIGAGLATCGKMPFMVSYSNFVCLRVGEQIRNNISYTNLNAKVISMSTGLTFGTGGPTHQAYEDLGVMRAMPGFTVLVPADANSLKKAVFAAADYKGPVFIRSGRGEEFDVYSENNCDFTIGKANILREGKNVAIISCGFMVHEALIAAEQLERVGIYASVIDMHTIKPIDEQVLDEVAQTCELIVTVEEHFKTGGLGSAVLDALAEKVHPPILKVGIKDQYPPIGPTAALRQYLGLDAGNIVRMIQEKLHSPN